MRDLVQEDGGGGCDPELGAGQEGGADCQPMKEIVSAAIVMLNKFAT